MAGPNIQMPSPQIPIIQMWKDELGQQQIYVTSDWSSFLSMVAQAMFANTRSGPTAERPTSASPGRYVGMPYFDTTLGIPVFLKNASSSAWVKADGTAA